jgi:hypothetical protein
MQKIWEALNGNKTTIGATILFVGTFFTAVVVGIWHVQGSWVQPTIDTINWVGMAFTGVGLTHKAVKAGE